MNTKTKRRLFAWLLLAVFVPMVVVSSLHIHSSNQIRQTECSECVHHHCNGHLGQLMTSQHACVVCQFLTLAFVAACASVFSFCFSEPSGSLAQWQQPLSLRGGGIASLRAPPAC